MSLLQEIEQFGLAPTKENLMLERAYGIAEGFFYCDDECEIPWQPFEDWSKRAIDDELNNLAESIYQAMKWAKNET
jgi:hypothetical protein